MLGFFDAVVGVCVLILWFSGEVGVFLGRTWRVVWRGRGGWVSRVMEYVTWCWDIKVLDLLGSCPFTFP